VTFLPYIKRVWNCNTSRHCDVYKNDSLRASASERRDCGSRRIVLTSAKLPCKWKGILRENDNKTHLFVFIVKNLSEKQYEAGKQLVIMIGDNIRCCSRKA
jgi:hypothetical protein